jgi:Rps23 Pro-64 3,4-dihydroxylase Tpa1-like proline 4-hydroxylase
VLIFENFLDPSEAKSLLNHAIASQHKFISTGYTNTNYYPDHRHSKVLFEKDFADYCQRLVSKLLPLLPEVCDRLFLPRFPPIAIEAQLTAHGHGDQYKAHADNSTDPVANRRITYVYYFFSTPKQFWGGELHIVDKATYRPVHNSIVFFDSGLNHEVLPVYVPQQKFEFNRFTVNGWVRGNMPESK